MVYIEQKFNDLLISDFGTAGSDYLKYKMKQEGISSLDLLKEYEQQRFIVELVHNLYSDIISPRRYREILLKIFNILYGFTEAEHAVLWNDFFKGSPPINFIEDFFGKDVGNKLIFIEENYEDFSNILHEEDAVQFSFVMKMIKRMFKDEKFLSEDLSSIFMKYLLHGKEKMELTFNDFMKKHIEDIDKITYGFRSYLMSNANEENITHITDLYNISGSFGMKTSSRLKLKEIDDSEGIFLFRNIQKTIENELGRYTDDVNSVKIVNDAKKEAGITSFSNANREEKIKFMNYIINHTNIMSFSEQKERMVKLWLSRVLRI